MSKSSDRIEKLIVPFATIAVLLLTPESNRWIGDVMTEAERKARERHPAGKGLVQRNHLVEKYGKSLVKTYGNPCIVCGTIDNDKAMCFKGTNHCCENHRQIIAGERES